MMTLLTLFRADLRQASVWLKKNSVAKILVFLASLLVIFIIASVIFWGSYSYFWSIKYLEPYGRLTASYVLHSGLIITLWFVFFSSFVQSYKVLINPTKELNFVLKQPIKNLPLSLWLSLRSIPVNSFLMLIFWLPVALTYNKVFGNLSFWGVIGFILLVTFFLTLFIESLTSFIALLTTPIFQKFSSLIGIVGAAGFISITWLIIKLVFPPPLSQLITIEIELFDQLFASLPLNQDWLLTNYIIEFIENGQIFTLLVPFVIFTMIICVLIILNSKIFRYSWQHNLARAQNRKLITPPTSSWYNRPHFWKEIITMFRDRGERNAVFFFIGLIVFFFYFLNRSLLINQELSNNIALITGFSLGAVLFISTAFLLRTVFPLLSREGNSAWFLIRETKTKLEIHQVKAAYSRFLIAIIFITANIGWIFMPLESTLKQSLLLYTSIGIVLLGWLNTNMGLMMTEWEKGSDPDQISTSGTGILTLTISMILIIGLVTSFLGSVPGYLNLPIFIGAIGFMMLIQRISQQRAEKYQYPQVWK